jgi:hypothetical protein
MKSENRLAESILLQPLLCAPLDSWVCIVQPLRAAIFRQLLLNDYESAAYFVQHDLKIGSQHRLFRINDHIRIYLYRGAGKPDRFPQPALDPVALHSTTESTTHREPDAKTWKPLRAPGFIRPGQIKSRERCREMPSSRFVYPLKIGMTQQSQAARELSALPARLKALVLSVGSDGTHSDCMLETADVAQARGQECPRHTRLVTAGYSRKPGLTETRLRPLARRRDRTFWPPWVFMRVRNPCFLDRLRRLGWNVRLGMKSLAAPDWCDGRKANRKYK